MALPQISFDEFVSRRARLAEQLDDNSAVIVPAARLTTRNSDVEHPFRQDSHFFYLTGFDEPDALLVLLKQHGSVRYVLFCQPRDPLMEIWHGYRQGPHGAKANFGADAAYSIEDLETRLGEYLNGVESLYFCMGAHHHTEKLVERVLQTMRGKRRQGVIAPERLIDLSHLLNEMRLVKSEAEIEMMRAAGEISAAAHVRAMQACKPGMMEYQLEAEIMHHFAMHGCRLPAYSSIVGGGKNGCVLHYVENSAPLNDGDLVLIDAGCEVGYYAGDITRTFPVNGRFSEAQRQIYDIVLAAQRACIAEIKPRVPWEQMQETSVRIITQGLLELGILQGALDELIAQEAYKPFYMHRLGHWLGMDVHDVGDYRVHGEWRELVPGMVMTVEPGIYISPDNETVDPKWRGIGIRIEDDVVVTATGCDVLTHAVPKEIDEIEALMAQA
ncbi:Xaa-Pro aminopeptidase [Neptunomonas sp. XY-337]|uniref:Xaa-Pro aminopeptidase n=1 Tax=Neptunomonas sp. XY-337 TaxID=2561897 RepID=UPI0010AA660E|nr:Xaa-Pro aminopeptidase [Neptunomonas sp. XY-337]